MKKQKIFSFIIEFMYMKRVPPWTTSMKKWKKMPLWALHQWRKKRKGMLLWKKNVVVSEDNCSSDIVGNQCSQTDPGTLFLATQELHWNQYWIYMKVTHIRLLQILHWRAMMTLNRMIKTTRQKMGFGTPFIVWYQWRQWGWWPQWCQLGYWQCYCQS